jgi:flavin reductase (DIM6/NTAB) family NADH-FMN oxidoreductase RutF
VPAVSDHALSPDAFRSVISHFASGVTVITTARDRAWYGTTASAVTSLSLEPPMILVCLNRSSSTGRSVRASRRFAVNILSEDQEHLAERFARKGSDKFDGVEARTAPSGLPLLERAVAHLECRVTEEVAAATHDVLLAEVTASSAAGGAPLAYYRGRFGRLELADPTS